MAIGGANWPCAAHTEFAYSNSKRAIYPLQKVYCLAYAIYKILSMVSQYNLVLFLFGYRYTSGLCVLAFALFSIHTTSSRTRAYRDTNFNSNGLQKLLLFGLI